MAYLLLTAFIALAVVVVLAGYHLRRRATGRCWLPLREAMLHGTATLPSTYLAQIHTRPEPEAGGQVMATDLINGARGALMLPGANFRPGSVVCFHLDRRRAADPSMDGPAPLARVHPVG